MKKNLLRILAVGLCVCLMFSFAGCGKPTDPATTDPSGLPDVPPDPPSVKEPIYDETTNTWYLYSGKDLNLLRQHPDANFIVDAELDCTGMIWETVEKFTGTLSGVWGGSFNHTISNLVIMGPGLFGVVEGTVSDLNFENVTVKANNDFTGNVGVVAGVVKTDLVDIDTHNVTVQLSGSNVTAGILAGKLEGECKECYLEGEITGTLTGGENAVGSVAGITADNLTDIESRVDLSLTVGGKGSIGGLVGSVEGGKVRRVYYVGKVNITAGDGQYAAASLAGSLNGNLQNGYNCAREFNITGTNLTLGDYCGVQGAQGAVSKCVTRDLTNVIAAEQMSAEEKTLREMVLAYMYETMTIPWTPATTLNYSGCGGPLLDCIHNFTFEAGETYFGMPYTHKCGSLERMKEFLDENNVVDTSRLPTEGFNGWDYYLGNDCVDAMYWAWAQISSSIHYEFTEDMTVDFLEGEGVVPVGNYDIPEKWADPAQPTTREITGINGVNMYKAYAQLKIGDGLLFGPGHGRMVADVPFVFYKENGAIDGNKSFVITHEQGQGNYVGSHCTGIVFQKYTFNQLMTGGYIPITVEELRDVKVSEVQASHNVTGTTINDLLSGTVASNYRINFVKVTIADVNGNVVTTAKVYPADGTHTDTYDLIKIKDKLDLSTIQSGESYQCTVTMFLGTEEKTVISGTYTG